MIETKRIFHTISRENNINAVRYYLAICILIGHFNVLSGEEVFQLPRIFGGAGSFFAISGFLLFHSWERRPTLKQYFSRRAARIFPPYFFVVIAAAVMLVFMSTLSAADYFASSGFWEYLLANLSFLNFLAPDLPGVFTESGMAMSSVNGSLWTMKGEVACYLTVPLVYWLIKGNPKRANLVLGVIMALFLSAYVVLSKKYLVEGSGSVDIMRRQTLVMFLFYMGAWLNLHLERLKAHSRVVIIGCGLFLMWVWVNNTYLGIDMPLWAYMGVDILHPLASGLMVIGCSITGRWGHFLSRHDPMTYEIYLFHFPIIQTVTALGWVGTLGAYPSLLLVILVTTMLAWLSYRYVSAPFIRLTKK